MLAGWGGPGHPDLGMRCTLLLIRLLLLAAIALACGVGSATAVIIDSGDGTGNTTAPPDDPGWDHVGKRSGLTAVYLGNGWVVTANHVLEGSVILGGVTYGAIPGTKTQIGTADLAVFQLSSHPPLGLLPISTNPDITGDEVVMIGHGLDRGASTSACGPPPIGGYLWDVTRSVRWGENEVDAYANVLSTDTFYTTFDQSGLTHEAQGAHGDSGGAVFVKNGADWELAGVMLATASFACQPGETALYGNLTYAADLSVYRSQLLAMTRPACSDEVDNDGDLLIDYPDDPDCSSELDDDEAPKPIPTAAPPALGILALFLLGTGIRVRAPRRR